MSAASRMKKPGANEHAEYYGRYINLVPEGDIVATLEKQGAQFTAFLRAIPEARGDHRYAPDKWSVKEVLGHMIDGERVFAYRALRFARGDQQPLPGFEQDDYVKTAQHGRAKLADLIEEFALVRRANVLMLRHLDEAAWLRRGTASGYEISVRALAYVLAGHVLHHEKVLREKYL